jgi:Right handed beta helix region
MKKFNRRYFLKSAFATALMLGTRRVFAQDTTNILYVDSIVGNDANDGLSRALPKLTLDGARAALEALGGVGTIRVHAPSTNPVQGYVDFSSGQITIEGMDRSSVWYCERGVTRISPDSAWTDEGGGIFSHALAESSGVMWVSVPDRNGFWTKLSLTPSAPTSPRAGQIGYSDGLIYVHLPGDIHPADYTFKRNGVSYLLRASGTARLTIRNAMLRHAVGSAVELVSDEAQIVCEGCAAQYNGVGFGDSAAGRLTCRVCFSQRNTFSGFVTRLSAVILEDCDGSYNDEDGLSARQESTLRISGGRYHHNGNAGIAAADATILHLNDVEVDHNGRNRNSEGQRGGIRFDDRTTGSVLDCNSHDNAGEGIVCGTSGDLIIVNLSSTNNTLPDVMC